MSAAHLRRAVELGVAVLLVGTVAGAAVGQPVFLSYVETGSMAPTMEPGDGFVAVPAAVTGEVERGDVVVFDAEYVHDGGLVTHRVIGRTEAGYVTRGDANPFPDQAVGEPPVSRDRVVATALQVNGQVVVVPDLGTYVTGARDALDLARRNLSSALGLGFVRGPEGLFFLLGLAAVLYGLLGETETNRETGRDRSRSDGADPRVLALALGAVLVLSAVVGAMAAAETQTYRVRAEQTEHATYTLANGPVPTMAVLEPGTEGIRPAARTVHLASGETRNVSVTVAPDPGGVGADRELTEHRYPAVLPSAVLRRLHAVHPLLAALGVTLTVGGALYLVVGRLVGSGRRRDRSRPGGSVVDRLAAALRGR
jgi:signal peptidase